MVSAVTDIPNRSCSSKAWAANKQQHISAHCEAQVLRGSAHLQDCIPTSLLKLSADNSTRAVKMFAGVQKYMAENGEAPTGAAKVELVQKLLHQVREAPATLPIGGSCLIF